jgi:hypothetical protein
LDSLPLNPTGRAWFGTDRGFSLDHSVDGELDKNGEINDLGLEYKFFFSYWLLILIFAIAPGIWLFKRIRRSRIKPGHCAKCGYDLRATPYRCPECGALPAKADAS